MAERDVHRAEPAGGEPGDRPVARDGEVRVDPREDAGRQVSLPRSGPLAFVVAAGPRRRDDCDERRRETPRDERVRDRREAQAPHVRPRRAGHPREEVNDTVPARARVAGRHVDHARPRRPRDRAAPDLAAGGAAREDAEARRRMRRPERKHESRQKRGHPWEDAYAPVQERLWRRENLVQAASSGTSACRPVSSDGRAGNPHVLTTAPQAVPRRRRPARRCPETSPDATGGDRGSSA